MGGVEWALWSSKFGQCRNEWLRVSFQQDSSGLFFADAHSDFPSWAYITGSFLLI